MAHSETWDAAYEADPADGDNVSGGAGEIRDFKTNIRERVAKDHYMDIAGTDADHGEHKYVTFQAQASDPTLGADKGMLYTKDVDAGSGNLVELFWSGEDDVPCQVTFHNAAGDSVAVGIPPGTVMAFGQNSAPTGWTRLTTGDTIYDSGTNNAMFCFAKTGNVAQGGSADPQSGHTHTGPSHTHTGPSHTHTGPSHVHKWFNNTSGSTDQSFDSSGDPVAIDFDSYSGNVHLVVDTASGEDPVNALDSDLYTDQPVANGTTGAGGTGNTGAGGTGATGSNTAPYYVELILAKKD